MLFTKLSDSPDKKVYAGEKMKIELKNRNFVSYLQQKNESHPKNGVWVQKKFKTGMKTCGGLLKVSDSVCVGVT